MGDLHRGVDGALALARRGAEMKRPAILYLRMLRYRVAVMLWMFMLLGAALHGGLESGSGRLWLWRRATWPRQR